MTRKEKINSLMVLFGHVKPSTLRQTRYFLNELSTCDGGGEQSQRYEEYLWEQIGEVDHDLMESLSAILTEEADVPKG